MFSGFPSVHPTDQGFQNFYLLTTGIHQTYSFFDAMSLFLGHMLESHTAFVYFPLRNWYTIKSRVAIGGGGGVSAGTPVP